MIDAKYLLIDLKTGIVVANFGPRLYVSELAYEGHRLQLVLLVNRAGLRWH